jgi:membrane-associated phospholipid phosphatase
VSFIRIQAALILTGTASLALPGFARAAPDPPLPTPIDGLGEDIANAFTGPSLLFYGGAVVATGAMAFGGPDQAIRTGVLRSMDWPVYGDAAVLTGYILPAALAPTLYLVGLAADHRDLTGAGSAALQALAVTVVATGVLKFAVGRTYPADRGDATAFYPFQRLDLPVFPSWPSGHTSACISVAASLTAYYPDQIWIPLVGYPLGLAIGFGLIAGDHHWASDVVAGALIGQGIGYSIGKSFRARAQGTGRTATDITLVPMAGGIYGLALVGGW